jgi:hypothetical protein
MLAFEQVHCRFFYFYLRQHFQIRKTIFAPLLRILLMKMLPALPAVSGWTRFRTHLKINLNALAALQNGSKCSHTTCMFRFFPV